MSSPLPLVPTETVPLLAETHIREISVRSQVIYVVILTSILGMFICLPFIYVTVSIKSNALIRPATEITSIRPMVSGKVKEAFLKENQSVSRGDILFTIDSEVTNERTQFLHAKISDLEKVIHDLEILVKPNQGTIVVDHLHTPLYRQSWINFQQRMADAEMRYNKLKKDYQRNLTLHKQAVISDAELENFKFSMDDANNEYQLVETSQVNQWQSELKNYKQEIKEFESQHAQLAKDKSDLIIKAPIAGSVQNVAGIYPGSYVFANQEVALLSPDTSMVVEAYVTPNDIGLITEQMPVKFQVDAFNYNQWGLASGKVVDISKDVQMVGEHPVFKIKCSLDKSYMQLKNGYKGYLQKGMTLQARFIVTERSLWQVLYDQADDWLNPNLSQ